jgi:hypothetical protein
MTRSIFLTALPLAAALASAPAAAVSDSDGRAVAQCRAELLGRFDEGAIRSYRIGEIAGSARSTRVTFYVDADRRYRFECAADRSGRIVTASFDPARGNDRQLAAGNR